MKSVKAFAFGSALVAGMVALATPAAAVTVAPPSSSMTYNTDAGFGSFNSSGLSGPFTNSFTFDVGSAAGTGTLIINALSKYITFTSVTLSSATTPVSKTVAFSTCGLGYKCATISDIAMAGVETLKVVGTTSQVNASYTGIVQFTPSVPEPAAWALMIGGIGVTGGMMRRRARSARLAIA